MQKLSRNKNMDDKTLHNPVQEIQVQNVLYCIFVIIIHLFTSEILKFKSFFLMQRILFVAIFGFIFLSGLKQFLHIDDKSIIQYYKVRFHKIILPYLIAAIVYLVVYCILGYYKTDIILMLTLICTGKITAHFYFVIVMIQLYLLTPIIKCIIQKYNKAPIIALSYVITVITVVLFYQYDIYNRIFTRYLFYYVMGCYAGKYYNEFINLLKKYKKLICIAFIIALLLELSATYKSSLIQQLVTTIYMPIATIFIYSISLRITHKISISKNHFINILDQNSYSIYLYHLLAVLASDMLLERTNILSIWVFFLVRIIITAIILYFALSVLQSKNIQNLISALSRFQSP